MQTTQSRVWQVNERVKKRLVQRQKRWIISLAVLCSMLTVQEIYLISALQSIGQVHTTKNQMGGATFLFSNAGGYVLVVIITFVLAVIFTLLCVRHREKMRTKETMNMNEDEN